MGVVQRVDQDCKQIARRLGLGWSARAAVGMDKEMEGRWRIK
jgi:hypothetical protein